MLTTAPLASPLLHMHALRRHPRDRCRLSRALEHRTRPPMPRIPRRIRLRSRPNVSGAARMAGSRTCREPSFASCHPCFTSYQMTPSGASPPQR
ncbi:hypothetical protein HYPSUDRAFT_585854 [Hypholoma sublateritium FD-334 SS-4]|uniref:Uncharacterized protein n=1 Tax=Hypholoma sublateritium (strain FD-334 SS-4) TaxID=945553 RepID=A0A0D2PUW4_HYPSF|nr:hypothetical protein HYPSUDRAFT_585854 [Hypholoma sublateritium FD-334 SS-4]